MLKKQKKFIFIAVTAVTIALCASSAILLSTGQERLYSDYLVMAQQYIDEIEYTQAIAELEKAIELDPKQTDAYIMLADIYKDFGKYEESIAVLDRGLEFAEGADERDRLLEKRERIEEYSALKSAEPRDIQIPSIASSEEGVQQEECDHSAFETPGDDAEEPVETADTTLQDGDIIYRSDISQEEIEEYQRRLALDDGEGVQTTGWDDFIYDEEEEELNITSIDGATTVEESQREMEEYIYRVYVSNPEALYKSSLPSHGYGTFEGYLSRYIDYYVPGDELYEVQFMEGSDEAFSACTDFLVKIPDLDITVRCIYVNSLQRYDFRSPLNGYE